MFLARHLEDRVHSPDLAWWQLPLAQMANVPRRQRWIRFAAKFFQLVLESPAPIVPIGYDPVAARVFGKIEPPSLIQQAVGSFDIDSAANPPAGLARGRRAAIVTGIRAGIIFGIAFGVIIGLGLVISSAWHGQLGTIAAFAAIFGAVFGPFASFRMVWPWYELARILLAMNKSLPWRLMDFLTDAYQRGVLRQVGIIYQFRHIELQHRLASRIEPQPQQSPLHSTSQSSTRTNEG
jgi:hypothetical protein